MITPFLQSDAGLATAFSAVATIVAVLVAHFLQGRVRLIIFSPPSTCFNLPQPGSATPLTIRSGQVMIQNMGRKSAKNVEVAAMGGPPNGYTLIPPADHSVTENVNGTWVMKIPFIAPKETVTIQILNGPNINSVRCEEGFAKFVPVINQRQFPWWMNVTRVMLMLFGLLSIFYFVGRLLLG